MRFCYALCESKNHGTIGQWYETKRQADVDPLEVPMDELKRGLRPWGLKILAEDHCGDGWYAALLVELDEHGRFNPYDPIHDEDIVWFYETEYVPAPDPL